LQFGGNIITSKEERKKENKREKTGANYQSKFLEIIIPDIYTNAPRDQ